MRIRKQEIERQEKRGRKEYKLFSTQEKDIPFNKTTRKTFLIASAGSRRSVSGAFWEGSTLSNVLCIHGTDKFW